MPADPYIENFLNQARHVLDHLDSYSPNEVKKILVWPEEREEIFRPEGSSASTLMEVFVNPEITGVEPDQVYSIEVDLIPLRAINGLILTEANNETIKQIVVSKDLHYNDLRFTLTKELAQALIYQENSATSTYDSLVVQTEELMKKEPYEYLVPDMKELMALKIESCKFDILGYLMAMEMLIPSAWYTHLDSDLKNGKTLSELANLLAVPLKALETKLILDKAWYEKKLQNI